MTVLRLEPVGGKCVDRAVAAIDAATLVRRPEGAFAEISGPDVARLVRAFAFEGIAALPCDVDLAAPHGSIPAIGRDLAPVPPADVAHDVVRIRRLTLGEATAELMRRRFAGIVRPRQAGRDRARSVLRGDDVLLAWDRRAWISRAVIRRVRASLRPVVFDRESFERSDMNGRTFASAGALGRWLFS